MRRQLNASQWRNLRAQDASLQGRVRVNAEGFETDRRPIRATLAVRVRTVEVDSNGRIITR